MIKRGRFSDWQQPLLRYDLLHEVSEDEEFQEDTEDPPTDKGGGDDSSGGSDAGQQGLSFPLGPGGDA